MSKTRVACCSCFIEKCVFFCKTKCNFEDLMSTNSELFIKERRQHSLFLDGPVIYTEYVIVCLDCFTFQLWNLSIEDIRIFDTVGCRFTYSDPFCFGEEYSDDIFTGNGQFAAENALLTFEEREALFRKSLNIGDHFFRQPTHKSCFTSLQKLKYEFFCTECKNIYYKFFEKELHVFHCLRSENANNNELFCWKR